jgi:hypothetical protein
MSLYPGMNGLNYPYGGLNVIEIYYPEELENNYK